MCIVSLKWDVCFLIIISNYGIVTVMQFCVVIGSIIGRFVETLFFAQTHVMDGYAKKQTPGYP